jgi:hypothetical protein
MRAEKTDKFAILKDKKKSPEYEEWFLRYRPLDEKEMDETKSKTKGKTKTRGSKKTKGKTKTRGSKKTKKRKGLFF